MNPFSVLESDDEDETPKVVAKTTKPAANKKPQQPQAATKAPASAPTPVVEPAPAPVAEKSSSRGGGGGGRGRGGGDRGGRGRGRGERKDGKVPKHEFERHSANGRGKEVSKAGSGKGNWGNPKEEAEQAAKEPIEEVVADVTPADEEETDAPGQVVEEPTPEPVEPETPTFTLDEYLAQRNNARVNSEIFGEFSVRTVDVNEFSGLKTKEDSEDTFISLGGNKVAKKKEQNQRSAKNAVILDVGFSVAPTETSRGEGRGRGRGRGEGRGARGEGRGARGEGRGARGEGRGGRGGRKNSADNKVDINDSTAFPSL
jgi:plasminogen activator inhibitor 1 RNA-binding protein